jgi:hypothetical protein
VEIDLVYTWVDGADPEFRRERERYADPVESGMDARPRRWRSNDELRYSMRSVACFAPWIRTIHLVTNGQRPPWLNLDHPKIRLVTHRQIYRWPGHLPTFNSTSIEAHLHRIPGLAEHFIYANDDTFLGAPVKPSDFFSSLGFMLVHPGRPMTEKILRYLAPRDVTYSGMLNAVLLLAREYPHGLFNWPEHQMKPYTLSLYRLAESKWPAAFEATSANRFRCERDIALNYALLPNLAIQERMGIYNEKVDAAVRMGCEEDYQKILNAPPKFFCIHDEDEDPGDGLRKFLVRLYPQPCEFEVDR